MLAPLLALALASGCATRSIREGSETFDRLVPPLPATTSVTPTAAVAELGEPMLPTSTAFARIPAALLGVEVMGEDLRDLDDNRWLVYIPLVPFARTTEPTVRAGELEPELLRALRTRFRNGPGDRALKVRCVIDESWCLETRTLYGLSVVGIVVAGILGPPIRFYEGRARARFEVVDPTAPPGAPPLFSLATEGTCHVRAGVAGLVVWYNTDVKPRDVTFDAWAEAADAFIHALPAPSSAVWKARP